jgi:uncharacterized protein YndB with AHSA1/START domain
MNESAGKTGPILTLTRIFAAPRERVYRAWTEKEALESWFGPDNVKAECLEFDPNPGGRYRIAMRVANGDDPIVAGEFIEMTAPERLAFSWTWESADYAGVYTVVELTFKEVEEGTKMTLVHRKLPNHEAAERHSKGWNSCFDCFEAYLKMNP